MTERTIVEAAERLRRHGEPYLVATVVCVNGAAYRHPGARMLLTRFRWVAGSVSGGCLEGDISEKGWLRTKDGNPVLVTYDATTSVDSDDDIRLIRRAFQKANILNPLQVVRNGDEALAYLHGDGEYANRAEYPLPTLLLLDLKMPRKNGFDVLEWIRRQPPELTSGSRRPRPR